jgi:short-subunit dehydrogenase
MRSGTQKFMEMDGHGLGFAEWVMVNYGDKGIKVSVVCPAAVETRDRHFDERPHTGHVQSPADVAEAVVDGLADERFLILPNPRVGRWYAHKTADYNRWVVENAVRLGETRPPSPFLS